MEVYDVIVNHPHTTLNRISSSRYKYSLKYTPYNCEHMLEEFAKNIVQMMLIGYTGKKWSSIAKGVEDTFKLGLTEVTANTR